MHTVEGTGSYCSYFMDCFAVIKILLRRLAGFPLVFDSPLIRLYY